MDRSSVDDLNCCTRLRTSRRGAPLLRRTCHPKPPDGPATSPLRVRGSAPAYPQCRIEPSAPHVTPRAASWFALHSRNSDPTARLPADRWAGAASQNHNGPSEEKSHSPVPGGEAGEDEGAEPRSSRHQPYESGVDAPMMVGTPRPAPRQGRTHAVAVRAAIVQHIVVEAEAAAAVLILDAGGRLHELGHIPVREGEQLPHRRPSLAAGVAIAATGRWGTSGDCRAAPAKRDVGEDVLLTRVVPFEADAIQLLQHGSRGAGVVLAAVARQQQRIAGAASNQSVADLKHAEHGRRERQVVRRVADDLATAAPVQQTSGGRQEHLGVGEAQEALLVVIASAGAAATPAALHRARVASSRATRVVHQRRRRIRRVLVPERAAHVDHAGAVPPPCGRMGRIAGEGQGRTLRGGDLHSAVQLDGTLQIRESEAGPAAGGRIVDDSVVRVGDVEAARRDVGWEQQRRGVLCHRVDGLAAVGAGRRSEK
eukprot:scaffold36274_cov125-Isochrysis_galbana.AAC.22